MSAIESTDFGTYYPAEFPAHCTTKHATFSTTECSTVESTFRPTIVSAIVATFGSTLVTAIYTAHISTQ